MAVERYAGIAGSVNAKGAKSKEKGHQKKGKGKRR
jgi:hypothetical protein